MTTEAAKYDPRALAVGQAVLRETGAEDVILFGSRARGDYREDSDIDLLLIHPGPKDYELRAKVKDSTKSTAAALYGCPVGVDLLWFSPEEFDRMRRSHNHVTAIAAEEGIAMDGQSAQEEHQNDGGDYSAELNITEQRCYHVRAHLRTLRRAIEDREVALMVGQQAHQVMEHAMKGLISASGLRYPRHHELFDLERQMRRADPGFTYPLESPLRVLNDYAGGLRYDAPYAPLGDHNELYRQVEGDVQQIFRRIAELTSMDPWQEQPS
jgi:predicted nucleotidyltransferase